MPELLPNTDQAYPPVADNVPISPGAILLGEALAMRLNTGDILNLRFFGGELESYRGEYIVAGPGGIILGHHARLKQAEALAAPEAAARGIPPGQLTDYFVPTLD